MKTFDKILDKVIGVVGRFLLKNFTFVFLLIIPALLFLYGPITDHPLAAVICAFVIMFLGLRYAYIVDKKATCKGKK